MKILYYSVNTLMKVPNFASGLDILKQHIDGGDDVYVLRCLGELNSCLTNKQHWKSKCHQCRGRFSRGMELLGLPDDHILDFAQDADFRVLPERFASLQDLLAFEINGVNLGEGVVASIAGELKDHRFDTEKHAAFVRQKLEAAYLSYISTRKALDKIRPDRVYLYNGRLAESKPVLKTCVHAGVPVYIIERAGTQGRYALFENAITLDIPQWKKDFMRLWKENPTGRREALSTQYYIDRRGAKDQGDKSFIKGQQKDLLPDGFDPAKRNIAVFLSSEYEIAGHPPRMNPIYEDQNDAILKMSEAFKQQPNVMLWVRAHPNITFDQSYQLQQLRELDALNLHNVGVIWPDSKVDTYALMEQATTTLTFGSTVGVEATFWGKPSVLAGRAFYEEFDVAYVAKNHEDLIQLLQSDLQPKEKLGTLIYGHGLMNNGTPFKYFQQTGLHTGSFLGETFELHEDPLRAPYYYLLRKIDKLSGKLLKRHRTKV